MWVLVMHEHAASIPQSRLKPIAATVVQTTSNPEEQLLLLTVSWSETTWGRRGIPYGVSSVHEPSEQDYAARSLRILIDGRRLCGPNIARIFSYYNHGNNCLENDYGRRAAGEYETLRMRFNTFHIYSGIVGADEPPVEPIPRSPGLPVVQINRRALVMR